MKIKALITIPIVLATVAYITAKGYIYYRVTDSLEKIKRMAAPVIELEYGGLGSSLNGSIYLDKVLLTPTGSYDEVTIRQLVISGDGPLFLYDLAQGFKRGKLPAQMIVTIRQLESPVSSQFFSSLINNLRSGNPALEIQKPDPCSLAGILRSSGLKELGFPSLSINGKMGYRYDKTTGEVQFDLVYELAGVESSNISLKMNRLTTKALTENGKMPIFDDLHYVHMVQPGYMKQIVTMCSANAAQTPDAFIDKLFSQPDKYYLDTLGFIPGPGLTAMLKQLVTHAGELDIWAIPPAGIDPTTLSAYRTEDLIDVLGITVSYNNKPVNDLSFSLKTDRDKPKAAQSSYIAPDKAPVTKAATVSKPRAKLRYMETDISDLPKYINHRVRIYTIDNSIPKQGLLVSITHNTVNVEHLLYNGKFTAHLHKSRIAKLEVFRRAHP
ncbi:MAG: hypothetical protein P8Z39_07945 [Gammaproteobacteria bacterium]